MQSEQRLTIIEITDEQGRKTSHRVAEFIICGTSISEHGIPMTLRSFRGADLARLHGMCHEMSEALRLHREGPKSEPKAPRTQDAGNNGDAGDHP